MPVSSLVVDRRLVLKSIAAGAATVALPSQALANSQADAVLFTLADLHAPYARLPALLDTILALQTSIQKPTATLINGDLFERGNVVCLRSNADADWTFLKRLASAMPVVLNIGNHETAIEDDLTRVISRARAIGVTVVSNLIDKRRGRAFAPPTAKLQIGPINLGILGLAPTNPFVFRKPVREYLEFTDPAKTVADEFAGLAADSHLPLIMSHAGVAADKLFVESLPRQTVMQGAHDHLDFQLNRQGVNYFHGSSWGTHLGLLELSRTASGADSRYRQLAIDPSAGDAGLAALIDRQKAAHLSDQDREIIATLPSSRNLHQSILVATEAVRQASGTDVAMLGHTTFGAPLTAGAVTRYDLDAFVRFGGGLKRAMVGGDQLLQILTRTNQFNAITLDQRTGDYVHVADMDVDPNKTYSLAVNAWTAINQKSYLGTALEFSDIEGLELKAVIADYLRRAF